MKHNEIQNKLDELMGFSIGSKVEFIMVLALIGHAILNLTQTLAKVNCH